MPACDIQTSLDNNPCLLQMNEAQMMAYIANLLCQIKVLIASGGIPTGINFLSGHGSPEGSATGAVQGQIYTDLDTGSLYTFTGTVGANTDGSPDMPVCDIQIILTDSACFINLPRQMQLAVMGDILCQMKAALSDPGICDVQDILDDSKCFITAPRSVQWAMVADQLCQIKNLVASGGISEPFFVLQSDDALWYELSAIELLPGVATLSVDQTPVASGTQPYRVLTNVTDSLRYKLKLTTSGGFTGVFIDPTPTVETETATIFSTTAGDIYEAGIITDGGLSWTLTQL